jgi:hypothetical protein
MTRTNKRIKQGNTRKIKNIYIYNNNNKGNNKITELRKILQRESQNS